MGHAFVDFGSCILSLIGFFLVSYVLPRDTSDGSRMSLALRDLSSLPGFATKCQGELGLLAGPLRFFSHGRRRTGASVTPEVLGQTEQHGRISLLWLVLDYNVISLIAWPELRHLPVQSHLNLSFYSSLQHLSIS